ncbi:MAG: hypothetical protein ABIO04_09845 [Ferruginibacter sp.]
MNSNFTLRISICVLLLSISFSNSFSQTAKSATAAITDLKATVENDRLVINWNSAENSTLNFCEVQSSTDGKVFSTIGLVMGADPKQNNSFSFKQDIKKMKAGQLYYRILTVDGNDKAYASNVIQTAKKAN